MAHLSYPARLPLLDRALDVLAYNLHLYTYSTSRLFALSVTRLGSVLSVTPTSRDIGFIRLTALCRFDLERVKALPKDLRDRLFAYMQRRGA